MSETTAPATVPASNGAAPDDATASKEAAVEQHRSSANGATTAPVEPDTPTTTDNADDAPASKDVEDVAELKAELERLREKLQEVSNRDKKRRNALNEERKAVGNYEALYNEREAELETVTAQLTTATQQLAAAQKSLKAKEQEIDELRKIELESFQEDDRKLAEKLSVPEIRALYQRLYGSTVTQAPPSVGIQRASVARPAAQPPKTLAEYNEQRYGRKS